MHIPYNVDRCCENAKIDHNNRIQRYWVAIQLQWLMQRLIQWLRRPVSATVPYTTLYITPLWADSPRSISPQLEQCRRWKHLAETTPKTYHSVLAPSWLSSNRAWKTARGVCDIHRCTRYTVTALNSGTPNPYRSTVPTLATTRV